MVRKWLKDVGGRALGLLRGYDNRLWAETVWFLAINAVTGYVFLYRGFEWDVEGDERDRVQRFMW